MIFFKNILVCVVKVKKHDKLDEQRRGYEKRMMDTASPL